MNKRVFVLNVGNTTLFGGVFSGARLVARFRVPRTTAATALIRLVSARAGASIEAAAFCSVVPALTAPVGAALRDALGMVPRLLEARAEHGLRIGYRRPAELGTDRLAAALGAQALFPEQNIIVVDCGTATTVTAVSAGGILHGGAIMPGTGLWAQALAAGTAQLPLVGGRRPKSALGRSPKEAIASGIHYGHAGAIRNLVECIASECFGDDRYLVLGTGGGAGRFDGEKLFTRLEPELILYGLRVFALRKNEHA